MSQVLKLSPPALSSTQQLMLSLIRQPSPTADALPDSQRPKAAEHMAVIIRQVKQYLQQVGIQADVTPVQQSLVIRVPGKGRYARIQPLLLTAHMDVVPATAASAFQPVNPRYFVKNGQWFMGTDGKTSLGADDKAGIAIILDTLRHLKAQPDTPPLEVLLSPDEEGSGDSLHHVGVNRLNSHYAVVVDEFTAMKMTNGLATNISITIDLKGLKGGHSGFNIADGSRLNANMLLAELMLALGSGPVKLDPQGQPLLSKNIGVVSGGSAENAIPTQGQFRILLRSHDLDLQRQEMDRMQQVVNAMAQRIKQIDPQASLTWRASEDYPLWQGNPNSRLLTLGQQAARQAGLEAPTLGRFHATTQAAVLATMTNRYNQRFEPLIMGPTIENAHSVGEAVDLQSVDDTRRWLTSLVTTYGQDSFKRLQPQGEQTRHGQPGQTQAHA